MFVVVLKFSKNRAQLKDALEAHNAWVKKGFDEGVFLLAGSLQPSLGGALFAHNSTLPDLEARVKEDPFVALDVMSPEILEISPSRAAEPLAFLK